MSLTNSTNLPPTADAHQQAASASQATKQQLARSAVAVMALLRLFFALLFMTDHRVSANVAEQIIHDIAEGAERVKDNVQNAAHSAGDFLHHEADIVLKNSALAGNVWPVVKKLIITPDKAKLIATKTMEVIHWQDLALIIFLGWFTVPLLKISTENIIVSKDGALANPRKQSFHDSTVFHIANALSQIARIALLVYGVDIVKIFLTCMGFTFPHLNEMPHNFAKVAYILWLVQRICVMKSSWISQNITQRDALGRAKVVDRLLDAAILGVTTMIIFDILSVQLGFAGKSVFAIGSVGTLVVSLASQGFVTQILNGLLLASSDRICKYSLVFCGRDFSFAKVKCMSLCIFLVSLHRLLLCCLAR